MQPSWTLETLELKSKLKLTVQIKSIVNNKKIYLIQLCGFILLLFINSILFLSSINPVSSLLCVHSGWMLKLKQPKMGHQSASEGRNMVLHGGDTLTSGAFSVLDSVTV